MISENEKTYYVLLVEGEEVCVPSESINFIETVRAQLPVDKQAISEVKQVTKDGKEVLYG